MPLTCAVALCVYPLMTFHLVDQLRYGGPEYDANIYRVGLRYHGNSGRTSSCLSLRVGLQATTFVNVHTILKWVVLQMLKDRTYQNQSGLVPREQSEYPNPNVYGLNTLKLSCFLLLRTIKWLWQDCAQLREPATCWSASAEGFGGFKLTAFMVV